MICVWLVSATADARAQEDDRAASIAEVNRTLDAVELEIERRRKLVEAGSKVHQRYVEELIDQYRSVSNEVRMARQQGLRSKRIERQSQQRRVALQLWQLDRLRPLLAEVDQEYHSLTRVLRDLRNRHGDALREEAIAERMERVTSQVELIERERLRRRMISEREFYDVRTWPELMTERAQLRQQRIEAEIEGPLDHLRIPIQRIIRLKWSDGRAVIDRDHWEDLFLPESLAVTAAEVARGLESRGWKLSDNAHRSFLPEKLFYQREPGLLLLYQNLRHAAVQLGGEQTNNTLMPSTSGGSFSTDRVQVSVSNYQGNFAFVATERVDPNRSLSVTETEGIMMLAVQLSPSTTVIIRQTPTRTELQCWRDGENRNLSGPNLAKVYAQNAELIEEFVFPLLEKVGVIVPPTRFDPQVVELVLTKLQLSDSEVAQRLERLLQEADSRKFQTRTQAMTELESQFSTFAPLIAEIQKERELSLEVRERLWRITTEHQKEFGGIESLIDGLHLTADSDYLKLLLDRVEPEQRESIKSRLTEIEAIE